MKEVEIYINTKINGRVSNGKGIIHTALSVNLKGRECTKMHLTAWNNISMQRLQARAMLEALEYLQEPCTVTIHINSMYAECMAWKKIKKCKNDDIWLPYKELAKNHQVKIIREKTNKYSELALKELAKQPTKFKEDKNHGTI